MADVVAKPDDRAATNIDQDHKPGDQRDPGELPADLWSPKSSSVAKLDKEPPSLTMPRAGFAADSEFSFVSPPAEMSSLPGQARLDGRLEGKQETQPPPTVDDLHKRYGVTVRENGDSYEYVLSANGQDTVLFRGDRSEQGLRDAEKELERITQEKIKALEDKYGITIT